MTNHLSDMMNSKAIFIIGANPAVNHPVGMVHILRAKEAGAKLIVVDPHFSRTAAKADHYLRIRSGTDIAFVYGMIRYIVKNNLHDKEYLEKRVYGYEEIIKECEQYTPEVVEDITGIPAKQMIEITELMARSKPAAAIWNQGLTQHTVGSSNTRIIPILQMFLGNMGKSGGGVNILRGHDNVQGASDMGNLADSLPGYYGLSEGSWKHFCRVWQVPFESMQKRFSDSIEADGTKKPHGMMHKKGYALSTWRFGVLNEENFSNNAGTKLRALVVIGNGISTTSMTDKTKEALDKLDLVVFIDPYVNDAAALTDRKDNLFVLPAASQMETEGSVAATNRSYQWRYQVIKPMFECREDHDILFDFAKRFGFYDDFVRALGDGKGNFKWPEDATKEVGLSIRSIGLQGRTAARLRLHTDNWHLFDRVTLRGKKGTVVEGDYYGLPWPCWSEKHPGSPILWNNDVPVMDGGMGFRVRWGDVAPEKFGGGSMLAGAGSIPPKSENQSGGHSMITDKNVEEITGTKLTDEEKALVAGRNWANDLSNTLVEKALEKGLSPMGNGKARAIVWEWFDEIPRHREPLHSPRLDMIKKYPSFPDKKDHFRTNLKYAGRQSEQEWVKEFPLSMLTGRLVAHMGTGTETRSAKYLAEVQGEMFVEIHPDTAHSLGVQHGDMVWVHGTNGAKILVKARHSYKVDKNNVFMPQNFSGVFQGRSQLENYPEGTEPYAIGEMVNTIVSTGFDYNTACPETKCGLCRIEKA